MDQKYICLAKSVVLMLLRVTFQKFSRAKVDLTAFDVEACVVSRQGSIETLQGCSRKRETFREADRGDICRTLIQLKLKYRRT